MKESRRHKCTQEAEAKKRLQWNRVHSTEKELVSGHSFSTFCAGTMAGADMEGSCKPQTGDAGTCGARSDSRICINATQERWSEERSEASAGEGNAQA